MLRTGWGARDVQGVLLQMERGRKESCSRRKGREGRKGMRRWWVRGVLANWRQAGGGCCSVRATMKAAVKQSPAPVVSTTWSKHPALIKKSRNKPIYWRSLQSSHVQKNAVSRAQSVLLAPSTSFHITRARGGLCEGRQSCESSRTSTRRF